MVLIPINILAQNEAANWCFGEKAGLNFNSGVPTSIPTNEIDTDEGCSTISDNYGNLLFYSDGITAWNKEHLVMQNGTGLLGDKSSTQSALIVPKPNNENIYYLFTVDDRAGVNGLRYSEIDMTLDGGLGGITQNKNIELAYPTTEKITAIESSDGVNVWVISHLWNSDGFISFLVSDSGVNTTPVISNVGSFHEGTISERNNTIGYLKASPNREKIACVKSYENNETQIFDFNATSGVLSNPITIANYTSEDLGPYGCEFSPDSNLLYVTEINREQAFSRLHQYDLTQPTEQSVINSDIIIYEENNIELGAIQQAIDGRVYVAEKGAITISVIENPNEIGTACNFSANSISLGENVSKYGLPPFIQSYFFATNIFSNTCYGDTTEFGIDTSTNIDSIHWDFGDPTTGSENTSTLLNPTHIFSNPGNYNITITIQTEGDSQIVFRTLSISEQPPVLILDPLIACETAFGVAEFDLQLAIPQFVLDDQSLTYSFYESLLDAESFNNPIFNMNSFSNQTNPQTIFVRLQNLNQSDCFSVSELLLIVNESPIVEETESVSFCENSDNDFVILDVGNLQEPINNYSFLWIETQETTSQIEVTSPGEYTVRITDNSTISVENPDGCSIDRIITVSSSSIANIDNIDVSNGGNVSIVVSGLGDYEYAIDDITGPYQDSNYFPLIDAGIHTVYVRDKNDCGISEQDFSFIGYPSFFTPNGDGNNDYWHVKGISAQFQPNSKIYIFDRFGKLLKELSPLEEGWDGTFNGYQLPDDDYWFSVTLENGTTRLDHFTLKR